MEIYPSTKPSAENIEKHSTNLKEILHNKHLQIGKMVAGVGVEASNVLDLTDYKNLENGELNYSEDQLFHLCTSKSFKGLLFYNTIHLDDKVLERILKKIGKHICVLCLDSCNQITNEGLKKIALHCPNLRALRMEDMIMITDDAIQEILKRCKKLEWINLSGCINVDVDLALQNVGEYCPRLSMIEGLGNSKEQRWGDFALKEMINLHFLLPEMVIDCKDRNLTKNVVNRFHHKHPHVQLIHYNEM